MDEASIRGTDSNPTFRGMRQSISQTFNSIYIYDLHGNSKRNEIAPDGGKDDNVFDIMQGVSFFIGSRFQQVANGRKIFHSDLFGLRLLKYKSLIETSIETTKWRAFRPSSPHYLFISQKIDMEGEYNTWQSINKIFSINTVGISTSRDNFCVQLTVDELYNKIKIFLTLSAEASREEFNLGRDVAEWNVKFAQKDLKNSGVRRELVKPFFYRPFDIRYTYYTGKSRGFHSRPRPKVMQHLLTGNNLALCTNRQVNSNFKHVFISRNIGDGNAVSLATRERTYFFPLYLLINERKDHQLMLKVENKRPNLSLFFLNSISGKLNLPRVGEFGMPKGITPEQIFQYIYAVFHSPEYRNRYSELLKIDFPRLPITSSLELFYSLANLGNELVELHLLESSSPGKYVSFIKRSASLKIEKVSYSNKTVWINKAKTCGFKGVPKDVWNFQIGGYQVCEKWLKDRQEKGGKHPRPGRVLTDEDIDHYQKIVVAINETIRIMKDIDEVINKYGSWPGAFQ